MKSISVVALSSSVSSTLQASLWPLNCLPDTLLKIIMRSSRPSLTPAVGSGPGGRPRRDPPCCPEPWETTAVHWEHSVYWGYVPWKWWTDIITSEWYQERFHQPRVSRRLISWTFSASSYILWQRRPAVLSWDINVEQIVRLVKGGI